MQYLDGAFCEAALKRQRKGMHRDSALEGRIPCHRLGQDFKVGEPIGAGYITFRRKQRH